MVDRPANASLVEPGRRVASRLDAGASRPEQCARARPEGTAVTIGAYDGVHLGHRAVIAQVKRRGRRAGLRTAVVTFDRHPASVVRPESAPQLLTDLDQKLELLAETGVDYTLVVHFDEARSKEPAEEFVNEVLVGLPRRRGRSSWARTSTSVTSAGATWRCSREMGAELGFDVSGIDLVGVDGAPAADEPTRCRRRAIRRALHDGDLDAANALLGRPHEVRGVGRATATSGAASSASRRPT